MSIHDLIPLITSLITSWPVAVLILAWAFHDRIKEIVELKFGDKIYARWGQDSSDRELEKLEKWTADEPPLPENFRVRGCMSKHKHWRLYLCGFAPAVR